MRNDLFPFIVCRNAQVVWRWDDPVMISDIPLSVPGSTSRYLRRTAIAPRTAPRHDDGNADDVTVSDMQRRHRLKTMQTYTDAVRDVRGIAAAPRPHMPAAKRIPPAEIGSLFYNSTEMSAISELLNRADPFFRLHVGRL